MKVIVIGSGFGGLSVAIRLQSQGFQVTILEKNSKIGGHAYPLKKDGYSFDMGPSLITAPDIIESIFKSAGKTTSDYLDLIKLDPYYRIYFHDGTYLDYNGDTENMKSQMAKFNKKDSENYDAFMEASRKIYEAVIPQGLGSTPFMDIGIMAKFAPRALKMKGLKSSFQFAKQFFKDPRHQFTFSFHPLFIGGNPFKAPAIYQMIPYLEKVGGVWFTKGGMYSVVQALEKVFLEIGGEIKTNSEVTKIDVENGIATGVHTDAGFTSADIVVSNTDFIHLYKDLIDGENRKKWSDRRLDKLDYSMSAFLLYLGVKKQYPKLKHHTLILSERYKGLITDIFDKKILPDDFSMYLHVPTRTDVGMAPNGSESMYVLIPVANLQSGIDWRVTGEKFKKTVLDFLENDFGMDGLQENIKVCEMFTPDDFVKKQNAYYGSAWGVEPKLTQTAIFRPHNRSEDIKNLYLVGASTHPGAGVPGVMLTAETTEGVILKDFGSPKPKKVA